MTVAADYDGPWKEVLDVYLPEVLAFFFPEVHAGIDWTRGPEGQDKELQLVAPDSERGSQTVDKLVKVWRRGGEEAHVLVHIEVQSQQDVAFAERMFRYHARLYDHYRRNVVSLAILGDERPRWRPDRFAYELWGCSLHLRFPAVKLRDYEPAVIGGERQSLRDGGPGAPDGAGDARRPDHAGAGQDQPDATALPAGLRSGGDRAPLSLHRLAAALARRFGDGDLAGDQSDPGGTGNGLHHHGGTLRSGNREG
jgi:hypothetical protein